MVVRLTVPPNHERHILEAYGESLRRKCGTHSSR